MAPTNKQMAGNQRRTLRAMRSRLMKMSAEWDGLDQFNMTALADLADRLEGIAAELVPDPVDED